MQVQSCQACRECLYSGCGGIPYVIYSDALKANRFCLCGMMAADALTLPGEIHDAVHVFSGTVSKWLMEVLAEGKGKGEFKVLLIFDA